MKSFNPTKLTNDEKEDFELAIEELTGWFHSRVDARALKAYVGGHLTPEHVRNAIENLRTVFEALEEFDFSLPHPLPRARQKSSSSTSAKREAV